MEGGARAVAHLPDELVVEILVRLPAKSLCRFKCVSRTWRNFISDPAHRHRFAQTLSGLFYYQRRSYGARPACFTGLPVHHPPGVHTPLSFLPPSYAKMVVLDSCNGLLLLRSPWSPCHRFYIVCNPATRHWVTLPQPSLDPGEMFYDDETMANKHTCTAALGFDPATSSHFYVFQLVEKEGQCEDIVVAVEIYSSKTGKWIMRESGWNKDEYISLRNLQMTYLNGFLHLAIIYDAVASVDTKGQTWRVTHVRQRDEHDDRGRGFVGHSQGRLLYVDDHPNDESISIYVLEDHVSWEWTFKHSVRRLDLIPPRKSPRGPYFGIAALHPDGDLIYFYDWPRQRLMSYDMTHGVVHVIYSLRDVSYGHRPFLPYVPLYSGPLVALNDG